MTKITKNKIELFAIELFEKQGFKKSEIPIFLIKAQNG